MVVQCHKCLLCGVFGCSIMGEADNTGIVPRFAEELFSRIDRASTEEVSSSGSSIVESFFLFHRVKVSKLRLVFTRSTMRRYTTS